MSRPSLKNLTVENLRGCVSRFCLPFEKKKRLTVIFGENGTGKSTVCDAFEFLSKGQVGSLDNRGLGRTERYWHSVGKKPGDVRVSLETTSGSCVGTLSRSQVVVQPDVNRPVVELLRRNQILALVQARAAERYNEIRRFIDVTAIEKSEDTLRAAIQDVERSCEHAERSATDSRTTIEQFWESAGKPGKTALEWAEEQSKGDSGAWDNEVDRIQRLQQVYRQLSTHPDRVSGAAKVLETAQKQAEAEQGALQATVEKTVPQATEALGLLKAAQAYLQNSPKTSECPLCESKENATNLLEKVNERIQSFSAVGNAQAKVNTAGQAVSGASERLKIAQGDADNAATNYKSLLQEPNLPSDVKLPDEELPQEVTKWQEWFTKNTTTEASWAECITQRTDKKQFLAALKKAYATCVENTKTAAELNKLLPKLKRTLAVVTEERHVFTARILSSIADEVGRLYELVHPAEGLSKISLNLDPNRRASLGIGADVYGLKETPPQAYFSDSHLDTLGLCVFIALAAMERQEEKILVLDDVLGSMDEPHVERLIEMLYQEGLKFQHCIMTTHYRPWKEKLRWGWLKNGQCQFIELKKWSLTEGMSLVKSVPDIERLGLLLAESPPDSQLVCGKAGVVLEAILNFLSQLYECKVPHKLEQRYTLGELLPAIDKKLKKALRVEAAVVSPDGDITGYNSTDLAPYFDELSRIMQARNIFGCHFNALSFELLEDDAIAFGQQVYDLAEALIDREAGWPRNSKSGSYWASSGETRRLHPLTKPN